MSIYKRQHQYLSMFAPPLNIIYVFKLHKRKPPVNLSQLTPLSLARPWNLCSRVRWLHSMRTMVALIRFHFWNLISLCVCVSLCLCVCACACTLYSQWPQQQVITEVITGSNQMSQSLLSPPTTFFSAHWRPKRRPLLPDGGDDCRSVLRLNVAAKWFWFMSN